MHTVPSWLQYEAGVWVLPRERARATFALMCAGARKYRARTYTPFNAGRTEHAHAHSNYREQATTEREREKEQKTCGMR